MITLNVMGAFAMRVLVTGYKGFIGSHLVEQLDDWEGYDLQDGDNVLDLLKLRAVVRNCDAIIHLAAMTNIKQCEEEPEKSYLINYEATRHIANMARTKKRRFIFLSSAAIYGRDYLNYGKHKFEAERAIGSDGCILRLFNVYGKGGKGVVNKFVENAKEGSPIIMKGGRQTRDFIHVSDVVDAILRCLDKNITGTYEIGTGHSTSIYDLALRVNQIAGNRCSVMALGMEGYEIMHSVADHNLRLPGFTAKVNLDEGIRDLVYGYGYD